jgi:hypothetical protein
MPESPSPSKKRMTNLLFPVMKQDMLATYLDCRELIGQQVEFQLRGFVVCQICHERCTSRVVQCLCSERSLRLMLDVRIVLSLVEEKENSL